MNFKTCGHEFPICGIKHNNAVYCEVVDTDTHYKSTFTVIMIIMMIIIMIMMMIYKYLQVVSGF